MTNNIQQIRESLQELYITMGQEQLAIRAKDLFKLSQSQLSKTLGIWFKSKYFQKFDGGHLVGHLPKRPSKGNGIFDARIQDFNNEIGFIYKNRQNPGMEPKLGYLTIQLKNIKFEVLNWWRNTLYFEMKITPIFLLKYFKFRLII